MIFIQKLPPPTPIVAIAAKHIHLELLQIIETNVEGAKIGNDPEYLHHLRVALRRTRSALSLIPKVFSSQQLQYFKEEFAWLQQITGPARDLDVHLLTMQRYRNDLTPEQIKALQPVIMILHHRQTLAQIDMNNELNAPRLYALLCEWKIALEALKTTEIERNKIKLLQQIISARLKRLYKKVIKNGRMINYNSSDETLHDMRKRCKKLRYMLEFFHYLYDSNTVKHWIKIIKRLVDELGIYQDSTVQLNLMNTMQTQMRAENSLESMTQLELNRLLTDIKRIHDIAKSNFLQMFIALDNTCERNLFRVMLDSNPTIHYPGN